MINYFKNLFNRVRRALAFNRLSRAFKSTPRFKDILDWYDNGARAAIGIDLTVQQRLILAAYYGLDLTEKQQEILDSWQAEGKATIEIHQPYKDLVVEAGRRSGKDTLLFLICFYEFEKLCRSLPVGQPKKIGLLIVHHNNDYCRQMLRYMASLLPYTQQLIRQGARLAERQLSYNGISIKTTSYRNALEAVKRCSSLHMVLLNECAVYEESLLIWITSAIRSDKRIAFSSAFADNDCMERLYELSKTLPFIAGFKLASWDLNPGIAGRDNPVVDSFYANNPELAKTQFEVTLPRDPSKC
jgi:hypothetical protein